MAYIQSLQAVAYPETPKAHATRRCGLGLRVLPFGSVGIGPPSGVQRTPAMKPPRPAAPSPPGNEPRQSSTVTTSLPADNEPSQTPTLTPLTSLTPPQPSRWTGNSSRFSHQISLTVYLLTATYTYISTPFVSQTIATFSIYSLRISWSMSLVLKWRLLQLDHKFFFIITCFWHATRTIYF